MAATNWFSELDLSWDRVRYRKTGVVIPLTPSFLRTVANWLRYYSGARLATPLQPGFTIAFTPDHAWPWYLIWPVARVAGGVVTSNVERADIVFHFDDSTSEEKPPIPPKTMGKLVNFGCGGVAKSRVADVFRETFGYDLAVDPATYRGQAVEKSELNGAHDGRIVDCPTQPRPDRVYQRVVDNRSVTRPGLVEDLRTPTVGGKPVCVFIKRRPIGDRFANSNVECELARPQDVFSDTEIVRIEAFARTLGLDWGGLDVLRDGPGGPLYIVDANKTDMGPPIALPHKEKMEATRALAEALHTYVRSSTTDF
jgi:hypothetical protein